MAIERNFFITRLAHLFGAAMEFCNSQQLVWIREEKSLQGWEQMETLKRFLFRNATYTGWGKLRDKFKIYCLNVSVMKFYFAMQIFIHF